MVCHKGKHESGGRMLGPKCATACGLAIACLAAVPAAEAQAPQDLIVQSTTSVRDSGLLEQVIVPEFQRAYPQWRLKVVAVGTGQAITNARAGQGDVLITHAPALEAQFVADGFSLEPAGRTIMWNDFVIAGPPGDPAGVASAGRHDAAAAFEAIAAAGAAGRATFVSRGDNSGTNTKEKDIWKLTSVARSASNEPAGSGAANPPWYTKAGLGMADTLRLTQQCPTGGCYTITDRGTLQQLIANGAITALPIAMDQQAAAARGGSTLMVNQYRGYALNPAKVPAAKTQGALAFLDYLTSQSFQARLASFPTRQEPGFFAAAFPTVSLATKLPKAISARRTLDLRGTIASAVPGARPLDSARVRLSRFTSPLTAATLDSALSGPSGAFRIRWKPNRSGRLYLTTTRFRDLSPLRRALGSVRVRAAVQLRTPRVRAGEVLLTGRAWPLTGRRRARLEVLARPAAGGRFRVVRRVRLGNGSSRFKLSAALAAGRWDVRVRYVDRGIVEAGRSATRAAAVG
jgi:tungstate transport system substrate-binding protein